MEKILCELNSGKGWDWRIRSFDGWSLSLWAGCSYESARPVVIANGVSYFDCPVEFSHPVFRLASDIERSRIAHRVPLGVDDIVVAIDAETMAGVESRTFFLVAESWGIPHAG